ncbi:MAG: hypothetical protein HY927_15965 [Elusimicrobia bacterium]|nr:hypothetical protein [Elusimicrobiota bacterium]
MTIKTLAACILVSLAAQSAGAGDRPSRTSSRPARPSRPASVSAVVTHSSGRNPVRISAQGTAVSPRPAGKRSSSGAAASPSHSHSSNTNIAASDFRSFSPGSYHKGFRGFNGRRQADDPPAQQAVPGALIRTAGMGYSVGPVEPSSVHAVDGGSSFVNETNWGGVSTDGIGVQGPGKKDFWMLTGGSGGSTGGNAFSQRTDTTLPGE